MPLAVRIGSNSGEDFGSKNGSEQGAFFLEFQEDKTAIGEGKGASIQDLFSFPSRLASGNAAAVGRASATIHSPDALSRRTSDQERLDIFRGLRMAKGKGRLNWPAL